MFERAVDPSLCEDHFTHESYRRWFAVLAALGYVMDHREQRALKRMLRVPPPPRVQANRELLIQALADRRAGRRMHIERLIN